MNPETTILAARFAPFSALATQLLPHAVSGDDGAHDSAHLLRVWHNACQIMVNESVDQEALAAAVLLHDCVAVEKNAPNRAQASHLAAERASGILRDLSWTNDKIAAVYHAIEAHSFSAGIAPTTLLAKILQDADRLDAIGLIGAVRCFYVSGRMGGGLYEPIDPRALARPLDDKSFALDHFKAKLFGLAKGFHTERGRAMAQTRQQSLGDFYDRLLIEIGATDNPPI